MPFFGVSSRRRRQTCHEIIKELLDRVIEHYDFSILEGHRSKYRQNEFFRTGKSRVKWPNGKHNTVPSLAVDVAPWINGRSCFRKKECSYLAGMFEMASHQLNKERALRQVSSFKLRWGGDWDGDRDLLDQSLNDLVHLEISLTKAT